MVPATRLLQLPQSDAEANAIPAAEVAVDDDGGDRGLVAVGVVFQFSAECFVYFDVRRTQSVQRIDQAGLGMFAHLCGQLARIEQHVFSAVVAGGTHLANEVAQVAAATQFQCVACRACLFFKLLLQQAWERVATGVRPMDDHDAHGNRLIGARWSG